MISKTNTASMIVDTFVTDSSTDETFYDVKGNSLEKVCLEAGAACSVDDLSLLEDMITYSFKYVFEDGSTIVVVVDYGDLVEWYQGYSHAHVLCTCKLGVEHYCGYH